MNEGAGNRVALVVIYNHQFNRNIEVVERIYRARFPAIFHLVPFYKGDKPNVIAVYENSHYFQGYVAQAFRSFFRAEFDHYIFVADDLILNPVIDASNYLEHFHLDRDTCFIPEFVQLHKRTKPWPRIAEACRFTLQVPGLEATGQLPSYEEAIRRFRAFDLDEGVFPHSLVFAPPRLRWDSFSSLVGIASHYLRRAKNTLARRRFKLRFPFVGSYSDIFVVSAGSIRDFCHYCGVFAASEAFVEIALPTAMVLSAKKIVTEKQLALSGKSLWPNGAARPDQAGETVIDDERELDRFDFKLERLLTDFPRNYLYLHPVKLSKWAT